MRLDAWKRATEQIINGRRLHALSSRFIVCRDIVLFMNVRKVFELWPQLPMQVAFHAKDVVLNIIINSRILA